MLRIEDQPAARRPILSALAFEGSEPIAEARSAARRFLTDVQAVHGILVSDRAMGTVQLAVSELATNAFKYASRGVCGDSGACGQGRLASGL
ncbi:hypothetical protein ACQPXS_46185 [Streptomyces sp. CA-142005]|uniref:hypothetical protein n=1 Tax=Streptomyces sp. CA-142005 TaxID=3240052 RepID=UPI003D8F2F8E